VDRPKALYFATRFSAAIRTNRHDGQFSRKPIRRQQNKDRRKAFKTFSQLYSG
jgi:hypothetical protein